MSTGGVRVFVVCGCWVLGNYSVRGYGIPGIGVRRFRVCTVLRVPGIDMRAYHTQGRYRHTGAVRTATMEAIS